jgi:hypothetical protein
MSVKSKFDLVKFLANLIFKKQIQKQKGIMKILPSDKVKAEQVSRFTLRKLEKNANININNLTRSDFEYLAEDIVNPFKYAEKTPIKSADVIPFRFKRSFADELADASKKGDFTRVQGIMKVDPRFKEVMKNVEKQKMTEKLIRERDLQTKRIPLDTMKYDTPEIAKLKGAERMNYLITSPEQTAKLLKKGVTSDDIIYAQDRYGMTAKDMIDAVDAGFKFPFADGGVAGLLGERPGYQDGKGPKMSRRNFMKIIGGLAALPVVGKLFKFAKPLAKTKAAPIAEEVVKDVATTSSPPAYFFNLVNKIKTLGNDTLPTKDKVIAKKYKNYVMEEDFSGNIEIIKKGDVNNPNLEDVYMSYKVDEVPIKKGKRKSAKVEEYEEYTARPDRDGKMKDVEPGVPDNVVEEGTMFEDNITDFGKASGGLARMLGE